MRRQNDNTRWSGLLVGLLIIAVIIAGSIALVRFRNRDRGATQAVLWALDDLAAIPGERTAVVFAPQRFGLALERFRTSIEDHTLPVDSVRAFYHAYALHARDGELDADDLRALGPFLGLTPTIIDDTAAGEPPDTGGLGDQ